MFLSSLWSEASCMLQHQRLPEIIAESSSRSVFELP
jgi:hypothetical protein